MSKKPESYLTFEDKGLLRPNASTKLWIVLAGENQILGSIKWYAAWRRYAFYPANDTVFESACLRELSSFCAKQTADHVVERMKAKRLAREARYA